MAKTRPVRGATINRESTRFNLPEREADGDWLDAREDVDGELPPLRTTVTVEKPQDDHHPQPVARHRLRSLDQSLSRVRAWLHLLLRAADATRITICRRGWISRRKLFAKPDAPALLRESWRSAAMSASRSRSAPTPTPISRSRPNGASRAGASKCWRRCDHPMTITTKSDRVTRDIDLLGPMAAKGLAAVMISVTSLDPKIAMTVEPRAPHPERRLAAVAS